MRVDIWSYDLGLVGGHMAGGLQCEGVGDGMGIYLGFLIEVWDRPGRIDQDRMYP